MPARRFSPFVFLAAMLLLTFTGGRGGQRELIPMAIADNIIEQHPVPSNVISSEPAPPGPGQGKTAPAPPPAPVERPEVTGPGEAKAIPGEKEASGTEAPSQEATPIQVTPEETPGPKASPPPQPAETPKPPETQQPTIAPPTGAISLPGPTRGSVTTLISTEPTAPDEGPLWELFNKRAYRKVLQEISRLRKKYPQWKPPKQLLALTYQELTQDEIRQAINKGDQRRLIGIAERHRGMFSCGHLDWSWSLAQAYASQGQHQALNALLARLIDKCPERGRLATLQKAVAWLDPAAWNRLADRESVHPRTPEVEAQYRRLRYDQDLKRLLALKDTGDPRQFIQRFKRLSGAVESYRDINIARLVGWIYLETGDTGKAASWFSKVRDWHPGDVGAIHGLALCALGEKRYTEARKLAEQLPEGAEGRAGLVRDAIIGMAQEEYTKGHYSDALQLLDTTGNQAQLPRYARLMAAWSLLHTGKPARALKLFRQVHRQHPGQESAQGIFNATIVITPDVNALDCSPTDEFLKPLFQQYCADRYFEQKRFLWARHLNLGKYGSSGGTGTPRAAWYVSLRDKTGSSGLSRLEDLVNVFETVWTVSDRSEVSLRFDYHHLDSDQFNRTAQEYMARGLLTGVQGISPDAPGYAALVQTGADAVRITGTMGDVDVWEPHVTWRHEGRYDVEADLGLSAVNGQVDPRISGHLSLRDSGAWGSFTLSAYAKPNRESILAYAGWRLDKFVPDTGFNGRQWGGVDSIGADLSGYLSLGNRFGFNGKIGLEQIDGANVRKNTHGFLLAGINRNLKLPGFDYFAAGFSTAYDHYLRNLSQLTPGHGGYFSPQSFLQLKMNLDFLTPENRKAMLKGHLDAGRVYKREEATPIVPLEGYSMFGKYPGSKGWGWSYTVELDGAVQLSRHLQLGSQVSYRAAPQYDETAAIVFIRFLFNGRSTVQSSDLGGRILEAVR